LASSGAIPQAEWQGKLLSGEAGRKKRSRLPLNIENRQRCSSWRFFFTRPGGAGCGGSGGMRYFWSLCLLLLVCLLVLGLMILCLPFLKRSVAE
jgi:hypothetical protein